MKLKNLWLIAVAILIYACNAEETRSWEVTFDPNKPKDPNEQSIINVAAGKFYKMNVVANSAYADKAPLDPWTSGTKLTDEETGTLSTKNRGVGWDAQTVEVIIDLGSLRNITEVSVHAISDPTSQIVFPAQIEVSTSKDKSQWEKAASPITYSDSNGKSDAWGKTDFSNVACRYVKATLKSSASTSTMMLIDEIKVMGEFHNDMKYVPEKGCYHGAFPPLYGFDPEDREGSTDQCAVALFEKLVGKQLSMILWYQNMEPGRNFSEMQTVREKYWGKNYQGKYRFFLYGWLPVIPTQQMANGELDDFHKSYFAEVAAQKVRDMGPIWFRPANEMNGSWTPYYGDPTNYVKAWRRMYNIAEQLGVTAYNVFVWSPNSVSMPGTEANAMKNYYPGDMYVDWLGVSCYPPSLSATYPEERSPVGRLIRALVFRLLGRGRLLLLHVSSFLSSLDFSSALSSFTSFLKSLMLLPSALPTPASLPPPNSTSANTTIRMISVVPRRMFVSSLSSISCPCQTFPRCPARIFSPRAIPRRHRPASRRPSRRAERRELPSPARPSRIPS